MKDNSMGTLYAMIREYEELLPCPFCFGIPEILPQTYGLLVKCRECSANIPIISEYIEQAIASWNMRRTHL